MTVRASPSGPTVDTADTTSDLENDSTVPGLSASDALDDLTTRISELENGYFFDQFLGGFGANVSNADSGLFGDQRWSFFSNGGSLARTTDSARYIGAYNVLGGIIAGWFFSNVTNIATMGNVLNVNPNTPFTLGIWLVSTSLNSAEPIRKYDGATRGYAMQLTATSRARFVLASSGANLIVVDSSNTLPLGKHFITVGIDGSGLASGVTIHIDGVLQTNVVVANNLGGNPTTNAQTLQIGGFTFSTLVQDASEWNVRLTTAQVLEAYNAGVPPNLNASSMAANLIGWWRFDTADTVAAGGIIDHSTGAHNATAGGGLAPTSGGTGRSALVLSSSATLVSSNAYHAQNFASFELLGVPDTSDTAGSGIYRYGLGSGVTAANFGSDGLFFEIDRSISNNWRVVARTGGVSTVVSTTIPYVAHTLTRLRAERGATNWTFFIDDVLVGSIPAASVTSALVTIGIQVDAPTAAGQTASLDECEFFYARTAA